MTPFCSANDESLRDKLRCEAIETLASAGISLHYQEVIDLLKSSSDDVSTYGLGLVLTSYDRKRLLEESETIAADRPNSKFAAEIAILRELLKV